MNKGLNLTKRIIIRRSLKIGVIKAEKGKEGITQEISMQIKSSTVQELTNTQETNKKDSTQKVDKNRDTLKKENQNLIKMISMNLEIIDQKISTGIVKKSKKRHQTTDIRINMKKGK